MSLASPIDLRDTGDLESTSPPAWAEGIDFAFGPQGVDEVCAAIVDTDSMAFESAWRITQHGGVNQVVPAQGPQGGFATAMATIVHLNRLPPEQVVARKLDACRWAFAWRIDDHRVAVAQANYREPRNRQTDADSALMRLIFDTAIRSGRLETAEAVNDQRASPSSSIQRLPEKHVEPRVKKVAARPHVNPAGRRAVHAPRVKASPALAVMRTARIPVVPSPGYPVRTRRQRPRAVPVPAAEPAIKTTVNSAASTWSYRMLACAVLSVYAGMAALIALSHHDSTALQAGAAGADAQLVVSDLERLQPKSPLANGTLVLGLGVCVSATVAALFVARRQRRELQQASGPQPPVLSTRL